MLRQVDSIIKSLNMIRKERLVQTFCDIAKIDSPSGEEENMAINISSRLETLGFETMRDAYGNLVASDGRPDPILLSAHLDTVEPGRGIKPFTDIG